MDRSTSRLDRHLEHLAQHLAAETGIPLPAARRFALAFSIVAAKARSPSTGVPGGPMPGRSARRMRGYL